MPEILTLIDGKRFLMNRIKLFYENSLSDQRSAFSLVKSVPILPGICRCRCCYTIQYSVSHNFSVFCKNFNLETKNIHEINPTIKPILRIKK